MASCRLAGVLPGAWRSVCLLALLLAIAGGKIDNIIAHDSQHTVTKVCNYL